ncbi:MAG: hypothetical protein ACO1N0_10265 [Fluviicola sp.]
MALYQFYLLLLPKQSLIHVQGQIPDKLEEEVIQAYFQTNRTDCWKQAELSSPVLISEMDRLVDRSNWKPEAGIAWKTYSESVDNDAFLSFNEETQQVEGLSFRADLREPGLKFLKGMLELATKYELLLADRKGMLANPDYSEVGELIRQSNAFRFLSDPESFLKAVIQKK